jgi:hypothetical protein
MIVRPSSAPQAGQRREEFAASVAEVAVHVDRERGDRGALAVGVDVVGDGARARGEVEGRGHR